MKLIASCALGLIPTLPLSFIQEPTPCGGCYDYTSVSDPGGTVTDFWGGVDLNLTIQWIDGECDVFVPLYCDPAYPCTTLVTVTASGTDGWIGDLTNAYACNVGLGGGRRYFHGPTSVETVYSDYVGIDCGEMCAFSMDMDVHRPAVMGMGWVYVGTATSGANLKCASCTGIQSE